MVTNYAAEIVRAPEQEKARRSGVKLLDRLRPEP